jgi:Mlc titration factor MtfA (ptsG expression regulator)
VNALEERMLFWWLKRRRRRRLLTEPFPPDWEPYIARNVRHDRVLDRDLRQRLRGAVRIFIAEKSWVGCGGLEVDDEIRVTIAAEACLLLLGVEPGWYFDNVRSILVYPHAFREPVELQDSRGIIDEDRADAGQAWRRGPVILSWHEVLFDLHHPGRGRNVVLHEFAHQLDALDGEMGGTPPLSGFELRRRWDRVVDREYRRLREQVRAGQPTLLDPYGASNRAEFFAVATECFFERPEPLRRGQAELYDLLARFYGQDPAGRPS